MKSASKVGGDLRAPRPRRLVPSGIDWIGDIPEYAPLIRLRYLVRITTGDHDTQDANEEGEYPLYVRSPIVERSDRYTFEGIGLLMAGDGAGAGRIFHLAEGKYAVHQRVYRLYGFSGVDPKYLYYYLSTFFPNVMDMGSAQSTVPSVRLPMLRNMPIVQMPLPEQQAIAAHLDAVCGKIDALKEKIEKEIAALEEYRKSLITKCVTKGLKKRRLVPSGVDWIGNVPEGWKVERLKYELCEPLFYGASESGDDFDEDLPRYIRITDITRDGKLRDDGKLSLLPDVAAPYLLKEDDILLARSGATAGKAFMYFDSYGAAAFAGYLICCRLNKETVDPRYVYYSMQGHAYDQWKSSVVIQATIPNISAEKYANYKIAVPPLAEQREIAAYLDRKCAAIDAVVAKRRKQLEGLADYRKGMIYAYVTGKKEVAA